MHASSCMMSTSAHHACASVVQKTFSGHRHYVQGVAWDPLGDFILTQSTDRTMRVLRGSKAKAKAQQTDVAAAATFTQAHVVYKHVLADPAAAVGDQGVAPAKDKNDDVAMAGSDEANETAAADENNQKLSQHPRSSPQQANATADTEKGSRMQDAPAATPGYIFQDESLNTFFRRLAVSPEGSFVVAPAASLGPLAPSSRCISLWPIAVNNAALQ